MASIFLFSLILGGGLLGLSLLGDLFGGSDADFGPEVDADVELGIDTDLDTELDGGADAGADAVGGTHGAADLAGSVRIFTIRNLTYFLFGFGGVGWLLGMAQPGLSPLVVTAAALIGGGVAAGSAALAFGWLRWTDAGWQAEEGSFVGCDGRVVLPLGHGRTGQIVVRRGEREHELRALPFDTAAASPEEWRRVLVIEMDGGTAKVSPVEALAPSEE